METTLVPEAIFSGEAARVHVSLRSNLDRKAHWNNEVEELVYWINPPEGWQLDRRHLSVPLPPVPVSQEPRKVEFELKAPADFTGRATLHTYALYYVCEDVDGTCLFRRQDIPVVVEVQAK